MNNLKFRVWNKESKDWLDTFKWFLTCSHPGIETNNYIYTWQDFSTMNLVCHNNYITQQFTGLKDKNNKDIYEGDIVSFCGNLTADDSCGLEPNGFFYDESSIHSIIWNEKLAGWDLNFDENDIIKYKRDTRGLLLDGSCEIIGNIFENPELLV